MIKRRFYRHEHGDRNSGSDSSSSSSDSELEAEAAEETEAEDDVAEVKEYRQSHSSFSGLFILTFVLLLVQHFFFACSVALLCCTGLNLDKFLLSLSLSLSLSFFLLVILRLCLDYPFQIPIQIYDPNTT
ncbi:hypothetical protein CsSME_00005406 [Camellia sinensis var. sinensis]